MVQGGASGPSVVRGQQRGSGDGFFGAGAIAGLVLLWAEVAPLIRRPYMRGEHGTDREFAVRERAVEEMVRFAGEQIEYVVAVEDATVARDDQGLEVACKVVLEPYASAAPLAAIVEARIRNAVYTMTGLSVGHVHMRVRHAEGGPLVRSGR